LKDEVNKLFKGAICVNSVSNPSPVGTVELSPGRESWVECEEMTSPGGTAGNG
jgi:hypothetical protein